MKRAGLFLIVGIFMLGIVSAAVSSDGLVSWWKFDETLGTIAYDETGNYDATVFGAQFVSDAERGLVANFDGVNDYIEGPDLGVEIGPGVPVTFTAWIKPTADYSSVGHIIDAGYFTPNGLGIFLSSDGTSNVWGTGEVVVSGRIINTSWHHVVAKWDGSELFLYVDGVEEGRASMPSLIWEHTTGTYNLVIGGQAKAPNVDRFFKGRMDDVMIYDRSLSQAEVSSLYQSQARNTCSSPDQTIMKLNLPTNAHGALWNDANYNYDVCYDGVAPSTRTVCDDDNSFLWLSDTYNSHASTTKTVDYATGVCYGDLECSVEVISGTANCSDGSGPILSLYSGINSHMAAGNHDGYNTKICCGVVVVVPSIYWADADGVPITTERPNIGDTIQAVVTMTGAGTFNIWEEDTLPNPDDYIATVSGESLGGNWVGKWKINKTHLDRTDDLDEFYFKLDDGDKSNYISINEIYDDSLMEVTIVSPVCGADYSVGSNVVIMVSATDEDDFLEGNVSVGGVVKGTFVNGGVSFSHDFDVAGNVQIVAEAVNTRGKKARHISNVMILGGDGNYVAACIDKPKDFSDMEESKVDFDASTTRAIVVSGGNPTSYNPTDNPTKFSWYWRFMPENIVRKFVKSSDSLAYKFTAEFPIAGDNSAGLRVEFS